MTELVLSQYLYILRVCLKQKKHFVNFIYVTDGICNEWTVKLVINEEWLWICSAKNRLWQYLYLFL